MPLHRVTHDGKFEPFAKTPFIDLEKVLEDWVEANPHLLLEGEGLAVIARQPRTAFNKQLDLLAVDESGSCVVAELKRGETPRDVVAQTLEYAAWVESLTLDQLDELASKYAKSLGVPLPAESVADLYRLTFGSLGNSEEIDTPDVAARVTFNNRQRLVIVAERFSNEVEQTVRYLRSRLGVDITALRFGVYKSAGDTLVETEVVVGREPPSGPHKPSLVSQSAGETVAGADEFAAAISDAAPERRELLTRLYDWAKALERDGLATLSTFHGKTDDVVLRCYVPGDFSLATIVSGKSSAYTQLWRTMFEKRAPNSLQRVQEILGKAVGFGTGTREPSDALLGALTEAYREAASRTSSL